MGERELDLSGYDRTAEPITRALGGGVLDAAALHKELFGKPMLPVTSDTLDELWELSKGAEVPSPDASKINSAHQNKWLDKKDPQLVGQLEDLLMIERGRMNTKYADLGPAPFDIEDEYSADNLVQTLRWLEESYGFGINIHTITIAFETAYEQITDMPFDGPLFEENSDHERDLRDQVMARTLWILRGWANESEPRH